MNSRHNSWDTVNTVLPEDPEVADLLALPAPARTGGVPRTEGDVARVLRKVPRSAIPLFSAGVVRRLAGLLRRGAHPGGLRGAAPERVAAPSAPASRCKVPCA